MGVSRRAALKGALQAAVSLALLACKREKVPVAETGDTGGPLLACDPVVPDAADADWVAVPLADYPALEAVGGQAAVSVPEAMLEVVVAQPTAGCYLAVWRICTHGACEVAWEAADREIVCPCHGSRFSEAGEVLEGPATRPLTAFSATVDGETLWIYRPL